MMTNDYIILILFTIVAYDTFISVRSRECRGGALNQLNSGLQDSRPAVIVAACR